VMAAGKGENPRAEACATSKASQRMGARLFRAGTAK
jgi:hypothetical protein